jgi:serine protease Do
MTKRRSIVLTSLLVSCLAIPLFAETRTETLPEVFKRVDGAVVVVLTKARDVAPLPMGTPVSVAGLGSGVLISEDGKVLTAAHVVQTADDIAVELVSGDRIKARVISSEPAADVALLQLERPPRGRATVAKLGDSDAVDVGEEIFVVGAPRGISHTLTVGHISARRKPNATFSGMSLAEYFQTDAAINLGNSGGPMFNMEGEVIGVVSHIISQSGGSEGLGFAVTSNMARQLTLEEKSMWNGLEGFLLEGEMAQVFNVPAPGVGLLVQRVAEGSPAARIGLQAGTIRAALGDQELIVGGDIILAVQGIALGTPGNFDKIRHLMNESRPGDRVSVTVLRKGEKVELTGIRSR